mgnify:CR=1 FL=1
MRPAIVEDNKIVKKMYNYRFEVSEVSGIPGFTYFDEYLEEQRTTTSTAEVNDVIKLSKDIEYFTDQAAFNTTEKDGLLKEGYYLCTGTNVVNGYKYCTWEELPKDKYQSVQDVKVRDDVDLGTIEIAPGTSTINLNTIELTETEKTKILDFFTQGTYIEGFVTLTSTASEPTLSIPYLGFYSGTDKDASKSYESAEIFEPFSFEKDPTKVYPSDLANDVAKQLVGKDNADMQSQWVIGNPSPTFSLDKVDSNDLNLTMLEGFHVIGEDPITGEKTANLVAGNKENTNTMVIQQFMLRSVKDNYFVIRNKANGKQFHKSWNVNQRCY